MLDFLGDRANRNRCGRGSATRSWCLESVDFMTKMTLAARGVENLWTPKGMDIGIF